MTYLESAEGITITRAEAFREIREHDASPMDFVRDAGDSESYDAQVVC